MNFIRENIVKIITFIVILVVVIIVFSFVFKGTGSSKASTYTQMEEKLKVAAEKYANKNTKILPKDEKEQTKVNTDTLINEKYIKELYSIEDENVKCSGYVLINKNVDDYKYTPYLKCGKYYETTSLVDYIKKNGTVVTSDDGLYQYKNKLIFRGENPNNFVKIDEGTYRIIEIEDDKIRLISTDRYKDRVTWDNRYNINEEKYVGINNFEKSRLKDYLKDAYNSDFFSDAERKFMVSYDLCIGKRNLDDKSIDGVVECSNKYPDMKIGMLYASEYMRASIDQNCTSTSDLSCTNYNFFDSISSDFDTLTAVADDTYQFYFVDDGVLDVKKASSNFSFYPVINIDKNALYAGGNGTEENPYTIR